MAYGGYSPQNSYKQLQQSGGDAIGQGNMRQINNAPVVKQHLQAFDTLTGQSDARKAKEQGGQFQKLMEEEHEGSQPFLQGMTNKENAYLGAMDQMNQGYQKKTGRLTDDYSKDLMERAGAETQGGMTLQQAGDPNNQVQQQVRQLYDTQGQGVARQGVQDAGVLNALGMGAMGNQLAGAGPMTGGQMAAMAGQAMQQGGQAVMNSRAQMARLKEQGIESGFRESDQQYGRSERARERASGWKDQAYGSRYGQKMNDYNQNAGLEQARAGIGVGQEQRGLGEYQGYMGGKQGQKAGEIAASNARSTGILGGVLGVGGAVAGGLAGGGPGAAAGGKAGAAATPPAETPNPQAGMNLYDEQGYGANNPYRRTV